MTLFFFLCIVVILFCTFFALIFYIYDIHTTEIPQQGTRELKQYLKQLTET